LQLKQSGTAAERMTIQTLVAVLNPVMRISSGANATLGSAKNPHK
jgi:hypothetical protein